MKARFIHNNGDITEMELRDPMPRILLPQRPKALSVWDYDAPIMPQPLEYREFSRDALTGYDGTVAYFEKI